MFLMCEVTQNDDTIVWGFIWKMCTKSMMRFCISNVISFFWNNNGQWSRFLQKWIRCRYCSNKTRKDDCDEKVPNWYWIFPKSIICNYYIYNPRNSAKNALPEDILLYMKATKFKCYIYMYIYNIQSKWRRSEIRNIWKIMVVFIQ